MRSLILAMALLAAAPAHAEKDVSLGVSLSYPEIVGLWLSFWPTSTVTIDARATPMTFDGGVTGHIPFAGAWDTNWRHDILVNVMAGYVHGALIGSSALPYHGARFVADVGYGLVGTWDFRLTAGVSVQQTSTHAWGTGITAMGVIGKVF